MHEILKPYIMEELSHIERDELVDILKKTDRSYFLDDLNFLTISEDSLCTYIQGTDVSRNFSYLRILPPNVTGDGIIMQDSRVEAFIIITCRDLDVLEKYLDLHYKTRLHNAFAINAPVSFAKPDCDAVEAVKELIKKYDGYYSFPDDFPPMFDYRFPDPENIPAPTPDPKYRVVNELSEGVPEEASDFCWTLYKHGEPLFNALFSSYCEDLGLKCISISATITNYCEHEIESEDLLYLRSYIASKYASDGYTIKNIATNIGGDNDDMCVDLGMKKYRTFIRLVTVDNK